MESQLRPSLRALAHEGLPPMTLTPEEQDKAAKAALSVKLGLRGAELEIAEFLYATGMCEYVLREIFVGRWANVMEEDEVALLKRAYDLATGSMANAVRADERLSELVARGVHSPKFLALLRFSCLVLATKTALRRKTSSRGVAAVHRPEMDTLVADFAQLGFEVVEWDVVFAHGMQAPWLPVWLDALEFFLMRQSSVALAAADRTGSPVADQAVRWLVQYQFLCGLGTGTHAHQVCAYLVASRTLPAAEVCDAVHMALREAKGFAAHGPTCKSVYLRWLAAALASVADVRDQCKPIHFSPQEADALRLAPTVSTGVAVAVSVALGVLGKVVREYVRGPARSALGALDGLLEYRLLTGLVQTGKKHWRLLAFVPTPPVLTADTISRELRRWVMRRILLGLAWENVAQPVCSFVDAAINMLDSTQANAALCSQLVRTIDFALSLPGRFLPSALLEMFLLRVQCYERARHVSWLVSEPRELVAPPQDMLLPCEPPRSECTVCAGALDDGTSPLRVFGGKQGGDLVVCGELCAQLGRLLGR